MKGWGIACIVIGAFFLISSMPFISVITQDTDFTIDEQDIELIDNSIAFSISISILGVFLISRARKKKQAKLDKEKFNTEPTKRQYNTNSTFDYNKKNI